MSSKSIRAIFLYPELTPRETMQQFRKFDQMYKVKNVEQVEVAFESGVWKILQAVSG